MGEVTLTDIKYLAPVGVPGPLELAFWADYVVRLLSIPRVLLLIDEVHPSGS